MLWAVFVPFMSATRHLLKTMVNTLIQTAILSAMEASLNQVLSLDSVARKKLEPLSGKLVRIHCEFPYLVINILTSENTLLLSGNEDLIPDLIIQGKAPALLKFLVKKNTASLKDDGVIITGEVALLLSMQKILQNLDLDWEYQISKFIGDIPTQAVSDSFALADDFARQSKQNLQQDIDDYLHVESKAFPTGSELKTFYKSIDNLRLRVDRLDSRTSRINSRPFP